MENDLKIALAQVAIDPAPERNLDTARNTAMEAVRLGVDLLVFPEMFMALPVKDAALSRVAESPADGPFTSALAAIAREHRIHIIAGIWEKTPDEKRVKNTAVFLSDEGALLTAYSKLHLFDALNIRESDTMAAGDTAAAIVTVKGFNIGLAICYDLRFPELFRDLAQREADLVIVPAAWYAGPLKEAHWHTLLCSRAIENTFFVAGANTTGTAFCGRSAVFDPFGVMKASAGESDELLIASLAKRRIQEVRKKLPSLSHRRRELF